MMKSQTSLQELLPNAKKIRGAPPKLRLPSGSSPQHICTCTKCKALQNISKNNVTEHFHVTLSLKLYIWQHDTVPLLWTLHHRFKQHNIELKNYHMQEIVYLAQVRLNLED
jgi:hypothetical protein